MLPGSEVIGECESPCCIFTYFRYLVVQQDSYSQERELIFQNGLGIDFRQGSISIASMKASPAGVQGGPSLYHEFPKGIDLSEKIKLSSELIQDVVSSRKIENHDIFLSIPREFFIVREVEFPAVVKDNLHGTLTYELERYIPFSSADVYFDYLITSENKSDNRIKLLLVVARKSDIEPYLKIGERIGEKLSGIDLRATALSDFIADNMRPRLTGFYAHLYHDGDGTELCVTIDSRILFSRYFVGQEPDITNIVEALYESRKKIGKDEALLRVCVFDKAIQGALIEHLGKDPQFEICWIKPIGAQNAAGDIVSAQALAMRGIKRSRNQLNLIPKKDRKRPGRLPYYILMGLSGLVLIAGLTWGGSILTRRQMDLRRFNMEIVNIKAEATRIKQIEAEMLSIKKTINEIILLRRQRTLSINVLNELTSIIPQDAWVTSINYNSKKEVQIEGLATKAAEIIPLIEASPLFKDTKLISAITRETSGKERFRVGFNVEHD
jgi:Tfp pilus assembly protein PilN